MQRIKPPKSYRTPTEKVRDEAERRLDLGFELNGSRFKCDVQSISRLSGMLKAAERAEAAGNPYSATFRTAAGIDVTVIGAAEIGALFDQAEAFVNRILARSAQLQAAPPDDPTEDPLWV